MNFCILQFPFALPIGRLLRASFGLDSVSRMDDAFVVVVVEKDGRFALAWHTFSGCVHVSGPSLFVRWRHAHLSVQSFAPHARPREVVRKTIVVAADMEVAYVEQCLDAC